MGELNKNDKIALANGSSVRVIRELGRGGQGIVYLVDVSGAEMALKWYIKAPDDNFYKNLEDNVYKGAPSTAFLWPEYLTTKQQGSFGYVMKLRPKGYEEFGQYLLARVRFKNFEAMLNAAMRICEGFRDLHLAGLSYQDLNDGNFFIHPETGDVLVCDNDNVVPDGVKSGILGKARYMAPEVVIGKQMPNRESDRYSLGVILFLLIYMNHPLEGARVLRCPCMTEKYEKQFYGSEAVFIYDETDRSNLPVRGVHTNVIRRWPVFPSILRETFIREFGRECLTTPSKRMNEAQWKKLIQKLRDMLVVCPICGDETFVEDVSAAKCMSCGGNIQISGILRIEGRSVLLTPRTRLYVDLDTKADVEVVSVPGNRYPVQLKNITTNDWTVETTKGNLRRVQPGQTMPVKQGLKVSMAGAIKGEIL